MINTEQYVPLHVALTSAPLEHLCFVFFGLLRDASSSWRPLHSHYDAEGMFKVADERTGGVAIGQSCAVCIRRVIKSGTPMNYTEVIFTLTRVAKKNKKKVQC